MSQLALSFFGQPRLEQDGRPVELKSRKGWALLAYLAATGPSATRDTLATLLWPEHDQGHARANLRRTLFTLNQSPVGAWLVADHDTVSLLPDQGGQIDVVEFAGKLAAGEIDDLNQAVALYRGVYLSSLYLPDSQPFEEWATLQRERYRRQTLEGLEALVSHHLADGDYAAAEAAARRQLEIDDLSESAWRGLMEALARDGQRNQALAEYQRCCQLLQDELGVAPAAETTALYEGIRLDEIKVATSAAVPETKIPLRRPAFLDDGAKPVHGPQSVFVAREPELERLSGFLAAALDGQGAVVFVTGEVGRGKTALLEEFARRAMDQHPHLLVASGSCNAYSGLGDPYLPFREVLGMLTGDVESRWATGTITREHARRLWTALPHAIRALLNHGPHVVPALLPGPALLSRARATVPGGTPWLEQLRERVARAQPESEGLAQSHLFQQVSNVLRALAEAHPLLLILDDLQWADTASSGLLFHIGRRLASAGSRTLVAGAYRPEEVALGRGGERHPLEPILSEFKRTYGDIWVDLAQVDQAEGRRFTDSFLDSEPNRLEEAFREALFRHTGGHPLFTVELLRAMQERGDLVRDEAGYWVPGRKLNWETLPPRVEGTIEERIGRLEQDLREILSVASVEGESFTAQVVARVQELGERQTLRTLSGQLERRHRLVRGQGEFQVGPRRLSRYRFAHALFQRYLYDGLSPGECRLLHREIAEVLEELYQGHTQEVAVQLARHYSAAGDDARALEYVTLAADGALASYAHHEAEGHYRKALALARTESQRAHLLAGLGEALHRQNRFTEALQIRREAIALYQALEDGDAVAGLYAGAGRAAGLSGDYREGLRLCQEGLAAVSGAPESPGVASLLHRAAWAYAWNALPEQAQPLWRRALEMARSLGAVEVQAEVLASTVIIRPPGMTAEEILEALTKAVQLAESTGLLSAASRAHNNLGAVKGLLFAHAQAAQEHYRRAAELARQQGDVGSEIMMLTNVANQSMGLGDLQAAAATLSRTRQLLSELGEPGLAARWVRRSKMLLRVYRGEWPEAARQARALQAEARECGDLWILATAGNSLARVCLESYALGGEVEVDEEEVEAALSEVIANLERDVRVRGGELYMSLGRLRIYQGRLDDARRILADAQDKARSQPLSSAWDEWDLLWLQGWVDRAEERWPQALAAFEDLAGFYAGRGLRWDWARTLLDWAEAHVARGEPGDVERARVLLQDAAAAFAEMPAPAYAAAAQARLAALDAA